MIELSPIPTQHGQILRILFNRPEARNALQPPMLDSLKRILESLPESTSVVLLGGHGPAFCAGFDLTQCRDDPDGTVLRSLLLGLSECVALLHRLPIPVVVAAQGAAIAGGCALLGGGDFVVTDEHAKLGYPVVSLGISPAVSAPFLSAQVSPAQSRARLLEPKLISGSQAHRLGLASHLVPEPESVLPQALAIARTLAAKPPEALRATRQWLGLLSGPTHAEATQAARVSLDLVNSPEQQRLLPRAWSVPPRADHMKGKD